LIIQTIILSITAFRLFKQKHCSFQQKAAMMSNTCHISF